MGYAITKGRPEARTAVSHRWPVDSFRCGTGRRRGAANSLLIRCYSLFRVGHGREISLKHLKLIDNFQKPVSRKK
jgi:hypothetical protein